MQTIGGSLFMVGTTVDHYRVREKLGGGGMADQSARGNAGDRPDREAIGEL
jgi:hypothetical protein